MNIWNAFCILLLLPLLAVVVSATMPMPSGVMVTGCMNGSEMIVLSAVDSYSLTDYPWIGNLKQYSVSPCGITPPEHPFDPKKYSGQMLEMTAALNMRDDIIVCPRQVTSMGPCMPVTLYGCVMEGVFLCSDYTYGNKSRYSGDIRSDSRIIPVLDRSGEVVNLSPYNDHEISITTLQVGFTNGILYEVIANESTIQEVGSIANPLPIFISRPFERYLSEKEVPGSRSDAGNLSPPSFFSELFSLLTGKK